MGLFVTSLKVHLSWVKVHIAVDTAFGLNIHSCSTTTKGSSNRQLLLRIHVFSLNPGMGYGYVLVSWLPLSLSAFAVFGADK